MNRKRNAWISILSAIISGLLVYGVYQLQLKQIEMQEYIEVIVPNQFIDAGKYVTEDMLDFKVLIKAAYDSRMLTTMEEVINMETVVPLAVNEPIMDWKLDKFRLMPNADQATFQIPKSYIFSIANEIMAGDQVRIYVTGNGSSELLFKEPVMVASVKSPTNVEVTDITRSHLLFRTQGDYESLYNARKSANATIDAINLNLTEDQWILLDKTCGEGEKKLVVAYAPLQIGVRDGEIMMINKEAMK